MVRLPAVAEKIPVASMKGGGPYNWLLAAASVLIVLALVECGLRISGRVPGEFRSLDGFRSVDSLMVLENFVTDEAGIYKFGPWVSDSLQRHFESFGCGFVESWKRRGIGRGDVSMDDIDRVYRGLLELRIDRPCIPLIKAFSETGTDNSTEFGDVYQAIRHKGAMTDWGRAIIEMVERPYNAEGFRSIPFSRSHSGALRVLVIGDSFVYGMSARPYYNSFTDILLARGYLVYSAGIPGTDPAQYAAIAEKYVPMLKPDMVIVCFYPGNDLMPFPREPHAGRPHEHMTNAGFFESAPLGNYLNAHGAYSYYRCLITIPHNSAHHGFWSSTAITSMAWNILYAYGKVEHPGIEVHEAARNVGLEDRIRFTRPHLQRIDSICMEHGIPLLNAIIPDVLGELIHNDRTVHHDPALMDSLFIGQRYHFPMGKFHPEKDFPANDYHFNNAGSKKYADFLDTLLRQHGFVPTDRFTFED
jgi:hypothetical protein